MRKPAARSAVLSTALALAVMGPAGAADARVGADWVGYGYPNHYNAVKCTQEGINNSPAPYHVQVDGLFGPDTYQGVIAFQKWWNTAYEPRLGVDGIVGPETGDDLLGWLGSGCDYYLPTTD
ncbi:peptidoglycan-binding domain-containing protein [Streptomyces sp. NPDC006654]|uniref:peptidoglycan-binding domain-containing protein n=1 Tax=unclassified Streptomyces TaxID=2593676 RepID=UPI0033E31915